MRRLALLSVTVLSTASFAMMASCSLGLDESLIDRPDVSAPADVFVPPDVDVPDTAPVDAGPDGAPKESPCTKDDDCATSDACLKARCDLVRSRCVYDVCTTQACTSQPCDLAARTCGAPKTYGFKAAQFPVGAGVGCGGVAARCFAAVYPYVFVGTVNGVVAFSAQDPSATTPTPVPVTGLSFIPMQVVASGNRVFFMGSPGGSGATARVPLAWIDVPADPFAKTLPATGVLAAVNRPLAGSFQLVAREKSNALFVDFLAPANYPTALVAPPLAEPLTLTTTAVPITAGSSPVAASGTRFLTQLPPPLNTGVTSFGFINNVGTATPTSAGADTPAPAPVAPVPTGPQTFASSQDGAVLWVNALLAAPQGVPGTYTSKVRAHFLVAGPAAPIDLTASVDVETYAPNTAPTGAAVLGPAAMLQGTLALVTSAVPGNLAQTNVSFVQRMPLGIVRNADNSPRRTTLAAAVNALGAAASNGIGYVLASESAAASSVYVFDPGCQTP